MTKAKTYKFVEFILWWQIDEFRKISRKIVNTKTARSCFEFQFLQIFQIWNDLKQI